MGSFGGGGGEAFLLIFYWFLYYFIGIDLVEVASRPRAILEQQKSQNGPNLGVKREAKSMKDRTEKGIDF